MSLDEAGYCTPPQAAGSLPQPGELRLQLEPVAGAGACTWSWSQLLELAGGITCSWCGSIAQPFVRICGETLNSPVTLRLPLIDGR